MTLIDTSAWIEQLRRGGDATVRRQVEAQLSSGDAAWCPLVRLELWNGARGAPERAVLREMETRVPSLPIDEVVWNQAVKLAATAREQGATVPATDLIVEACARRHKAPLLHCDRHFELICAL
jgi:predicted nucleic acid-binding protein